MPTLLVRRWQEGKSESGDVFAQRRLSGT
ncbi:hypothetical protein ARSEF4850_007745, partial [Beauveria asiatica]